MAGLKPIQTEFGIHHRLESCDPPILCHTHVVAQVVVAGVGDGEVVPPGVAVLKSLLMNHPHLVGEGLVSEVVDHPTIVNPPMDGKQKNPFISLRSWGAGAIDPTNLRTQLSNL